MRRFALGLLVALCLSAAATPARGDSVGAIDSPSDGSTVFGIVPVRGWFLDTNPVIDVQILVDGQCFDPSDSGCRNSTTAVTNIPRPDVIQSHPGFSPNATPNPGFLGYFAASQFAGGSHTVTVQATESNNPSNPVTIASVTVNVSHGINQAPFGAINQPTGDPGVTQGANSAFLIQGWAIDDGAIDHVDILLDGADTVRAFCCGPRPDVQAVYPAVPNSLYSGWSAYIDSTALINGTHVISVRATDNEGLSSIIGVRTVQVDNASLNLHPFGELQYPLDESTIPQVVCLPAKPVTVSNGGCPVSPPQVCTIASSGCLSVNRNNLNPVTGWVLDTGARLDQGQTAYVQLLIDGVIIADTRQDCVLLSGAYTNCYGVTRPDVEARFPGFVNSVNAGFEFDFAAIDDGTGHLGIWIPSNSAIAGETGMCPTGSAGAVCLREVTSIVPGKHDISVRAGDVAETVAVIGNPISVLFTTGCKAETSIDQPAYGNVETPRDFALLTGSTTVSGWAFDPDGYSCNAGDSESHIDVDVDGHYEDIVTQGPCSPCLPVTPCVVDPNCEPASPGSSFAAVSDDNRAHWCVLRPDVPINDVRVPLTFCSPDPPCTDLPASWLEGNAKVGWSFRLDTTKLANTAHDLNVYASDCRGNRVLIGRRRFVVFNEPPRGTVDLPPEVGPAPVGRNHRP